MTRQARSLRGAELAGEATMQPAVERAELEVEVVADGDGDVEILIDVLAGKPAPRATQVDADLVLEDRGGLADRGGDVDVRAHAAAPIFG